MPTTLVRLLLHFYIVVFFYCSAGCHNNNTTINPTQNSPQKVTSKIVHAPQTILPTRFIQINHEGIAFSLVTFDARKQNLFLADQPNGPGTIWESAKAAAKEHNGIAAINAGFFTPEGKPLGIVISEGNKLGYYNKSSLGSGIFYHTQDGAKISRRSIWNTLSKDAPAHLLQSGPILLENSLPISGLSKNNPRPRSFIATDGKNHWCIGHADSCTLSKLSNALASLNTSGFKPNTVLNLDGGRSSDLWVSASVNGESFEIRPFWNKQVRNFLILKSN